jgi:uncharacterized coiled-coil protein SlyX
MGVPSYWEKGLAEQDIYLNNKIDEQEAVITEQGGYIDSLSDGLEAHVERIEKLEEKVELLGSLILRMHGLVGSDELDIPTLEMLNRVTKEKNIE